MVADPFHLLDWAVTCEGGAGLVMTSVARARDLDCEPIYMLGAAIERQGMAYTSPPVWDRYGLSGRTSAQKAFEQAGLTPGDGDVAEFSDPSSFAILRQP